MNTTHHQAHQPRHAEITLTLFALQAELDAARDRLIAAIESAEKTPVPRPRRIADLIKAALQHAPPEGMTLDETINAIRTENPGVNILSIATQIYKQAADDILRTDDGRGMARRYSLR
jgi:hypothetical protein